MKRVVVGLAIGIATFVIGVGAARALYDGKPVGPEDKPRPEQQVANLASGKAALEMVFVLDTTGSMSGLIESAKQRIWGIVNEVMQSQSRPVVRVGLVAYRDRGDAYITNVLPLTVDLDQVYSALMLYKAEGGGDTPENVRRALADGVRNAGWSQWSPDVSQILFLVGDAPPHDDYQDEPDTEVTALEAVRKGIIVNTIQCGAIDGTREAWQAIARRGEGQFFAIAQDGGVHAIATPYDKSLSELGARLGATYLPYGEGRSEAKIRQDNLETGFAARAPGVAVAERALNKAVNSNAYVNDLLQNIENGSIKLESVKEAELPDELRNLSASARKAEVEKRLEERRKIREEILKVSKQRDEFLQSERKKLAASSRNAGFDTAVSSALKEQLSRKRVKR
jgi:Mg-chelatase subunit ChlD